jgi:hypothetical protein
VQKPADVLGVYVYVPIATATNAAVNPGGVA